MISDVFATSKNRSNSHLQPPEKSLNRLIEKSIVTPFRQAIVPNRASGFVGFPDSNSVPGDAHVLQHQ